MLSSGSDAAGKLAPDVRRRWPCGHRAVWRDATIYQQRTLRRADFSDHGAVGLDYARKLRAEVAFFV
jgi:hypothetical protein